MLSHNIQRFLRACSRITIAAIVAVTIVVPLPAYASSWSPTLLVNTEAFEMIDAGDGATNIELQFGASTKTLKFLYTNQKFQFSHSLSVLGSISGSSLTIDGVSSFSGASTFKNAVTVRSTLSGQTLRVSGNADIHGALAATGAIRTDSNLTINDDADSNDAVFTFGNTTANQTLKFLNSTQRFQFSKSLSVVGSISGSSLTVDGVSSFSGASTFKNNVTIRGNSTILGTLSGENLIVSGVSSQSGAATFKSTVTVRSTLSGQTLRVSGNADIHGALAATGAIRTDSNLTINDDADSNDAVFTFGNTTGNQTLKFLNTSQRFEFSKTFRVLGTITGSALRVDGNATIGGPLTVTGAIKAKGGLSGATLTVDGNLTLHGVTYGAPSAQGAANTFLKNDGAGNLTWGSAAVGNGSGGIISLHPEFPNAIYFSSGANLVGQLTASGSAALNENFYHWTSTRATLQDYWISVRFRIPDNFSSWDPIKPVEIRYRTTDGSSANNYLKVLMKDTNNNYIPTLSGALVNPTFTTAKLKGPETSGTFATKGYATIYIKMAALTGKFAELGYMNLNYETTTP